MPKKPVTARTRTLEAPTGAFLVLLAGMAGLLLAVGLVIVPR
jgi:hypothetical protein